MPHPAEDLDLEVTGTQVVATERQRAIQVLQRRQPVPPAAVHFGQCMITGRCPRLIPRRLVKGCVGVCNQAVRLGRSGGKKIELIADAKPKAVERFAVIGVGIAEDQPLDRLAEMRLCRIEFPTPQMPQTQGVVATIVQRVAAKRLAPVEGRAARGVPVLLQVQAGEVQFVGAGEVLRQGRLRGRRRHLAPYDRPRLIGDDLLARRIDHLQPQLRRFGPRGQVDGFHQWRVGGQIDLKGRQQAVRGREQYCRPREQAGDRDPRADGCRLDAQANRRCSIGVAGRADLLDRIPELTPGFGFAGLEKREIGLVVGVHPRHQFDVRAVLVGQIAVPGIPELMIAPCPLFLAGGNMMIGHMDDARLPGMIVAAEEVLLRPHAHVGCGHRYVGIPRQIVGRIPELSGAAAMGRYEVCRTLVGRHAFTAPAVVIDAVVASLAERILAHRPAGVIGDVSDVGGKKDW